jgi:N-acyl-L-homoserine lactone synthetase
MNDISKIVKQESDGSLQGASRKRVDMPIQRQLEFRLALTDAEKEECFRLRLTAYAAAGYIKDKKKFDKGMERDMFDDFAFHFYARNMESEENVGYVRVVPDSSEGLPMEKYASLDDFRTPEKVLMEHSRWISFPRGQPDVNWGLYNATVQFGHIYGITHFVGLGFVRMKRFYESRGFCQIEPYREIHFKEDGGYTPDALFFRTAFDFEKIFSKRGEGIPFTHHDVPNEKVFRGLDPDPRIKIEVPGWQIVRELPKLGKAATYNNGSLLLGR